MIIYWLDLETTGLDPKQHLQALLGSDPVREILAWKRADAGLEHPSCFFERSALDAT